jgi:hypothetical protein
MLQRRMLPATVLCLVSAWSHPSVATPSFQLHSEKTEWRQTGRYAEVEELCQQLPKQYPKLVRCFEFGRTPEGRPQLALTVGQAGFLEAKVNHEKKRPIVAFQGGIHAGEVDGKDAGFLFVRDVLEGKVLPGVLEKLTLLFVPVFNVDGHERFAPNNRPNQNGPEETGWRTTAQNFNLNRDYLKAEAPEMQAMLRLLDAWDPIVYMDLHVTDGAQFQHDIAVMIDPATAGPEALQKPAAALRDRVMSDLEKAGHLPLWFYPSFEKMDDPTSGIRHGPSTPRFSNGYWASSNRIGILVETHSWRPFSQRVKSTYNTLRSVTGAAAAEGQAWLKAAEAADRQFANRVGQEVILSYKNTDKVTNFDFQGYAYTRDLSDVSGQLMTRYDPKTPQVWKMPLRAEVIPHVVLQVPKGGYIVPPAYQKLLREKFRLHGIQFTELTTAQTLVASVYRMRDTKLSSQSFEKRQRAEYQGEWQEKTETFPTGSLFVPANQSRILLAMQLLEPASADSLLSWGFFNEVFERKEYMEPYVAEEVARKMLDNPTVRKEFTEKLKDPAFAKDPQQRLDFFYQRHPSFDQAWNRYPILKTDENPLTKKQLSQGL